MIKDCKDRRGDQGNGKSKEMKNTHMQFFCVMSVVGLFFFFFAFSFFELLTQAQREHGDSIHKTTLVVMAYDPARARNHDEIFRYYCRMPDIFDRILFIWCNPDLRAPSPPPCQVSVQIVVSNDSSLNSRFAFASEVRTQTTLSLDDDLIVPRNIVLGLLKASRAHNLVGLDGRSFSDDGTYSFYHWMYKNKMVLTKTWVLPVAFWDLYMQDPGIINFVAAQHNCEDIAMNFIVRNATGEEPVMFSPGLFEKQRIDLDDTGGLSISGDAWKWPGKRSQCVRWLMRHFE